MDSKLFHNPCSCGMPAFGIEEYLDDTALEKFTCPSCGYEAEVSQTDGETRRSIFLGICPACKTQVTKLSCSAD